MREGVGSVAKVVVGLGMEVGDLVKLVVEQEWVVEEGWERVAVGLVMVVAVLGWVEEDSAKVVAVLGWVVED